MSCELILQEIHEEFINSIEYEKFLWELNNVEPNENSGNS
jgi:hypothetical protein